jgi:prepilin-type N-terminal cleavage/methylation domain-containing protein
MSARRGFSIVEVMLSVGLLGVGIAAAVRLFHEAQNRTSWTTQRTTGMQLALERLEYLGTRDLSNLPACTGPLACRASATTMQAALSPAASGYQCTQYTSGQTILDPYSATSLASYRIDTVVQPHPDVTRESNAQVVTVSVCWTDQSGQVQQAQGRRLLAYDGSM